MNGTMIDLRLKAPLSIAYKDQVVLKLSGAPYCMDTLSQFFPVFQVTLDVKTLKAYRGRIIETELDVPNIPQNYLAMINMVSCAMQLPTSFGNERIRMQKTLKSAIPVTAVNYFIGQAGYKDFQLG